MGKKQDEGKIKWTKKGRKEGAEGEGEIGSRVDKEQEEGKI